MSIPNQTKKHQVWFQNRRAKWRKAERLKDEQRKRENGVDPALMSDKVSPQAVHSRSNSTLIIRAHSAQMGMDNSRDSSPDICGGGDEDVKTDHGSGRRSSSACGPGHSPRATDSDAERSSTGGTAQQHSAIITAAMAAIAHPSDAQSHRSPHSELGSAGTPSPGLRYASATQRLLRYARLCNALFSLFPSLSRMQMQMQQHTDNGAPPTTPTPPKSESPIEVGGPIALTTGHGHRSMMRPSSGSNSSSSGSASGGGGSSISHVGGSLFTGFSET